MVARQFIVRFAAGEFPVEYDTDDGIEVLRFQIFSITDVPPEDQKIVVESDGIVVDDGTDLESISEKLRLVSIAENDGGKEPEIEAAEQMANSQQLSDEDLALFFQAEEEALLLQQYSANGSSEEFRMRVTPYVHQILMYEDPIRQEAARKSVPVHELEEKVLIGLAKEGKFKPSKDEERHAFLLQLLFWFKQSFSWVDSPPCDSCGRGTSNIGMGSPFPSEINFGASRVEIYMCNFCSKTTRFPRYNDPSKLIETRKGRCGEWANCFTFYCRAFGFDARLVLDFTDHVWTECFSPLHGRWMHLDPCESVYDNPLLYEEGWKKKLNYAIAVSKDGVYDVTKRYTRKWLEVLSRRTITTEASVASCLLSITGTCRRGYSAEKLAAVQNRDRKESDELEQTKYLKVNSSITLPGRQSGSVEWRKARSELGISESWSLSSSSCSVRICVDDHVSNIYGAFRLLLSNFCQYNLTKNKQQEVLENLKTLLLNLKSSNFRNRKSLLNAGTLLFTEEVMNWIDGLLLSISFKTEKNENGVGVLVMAVGDPIHNSLALPVALDTIDEILAKFKVNEISASNLCFPKAFRISAGSVLASGEELPFGIATAAFDGITSSKWEEPNGAKGCWLMYKVSGGKLYELESYDLMSANDAPERDPAEWILEGSSDGGSTWTLLDKRTSQVFSSRFLRRSFEVEKRFTGNAFRFQFLKARDSNSNSRFQIGSIDLFATSS